MKRMIIIMNIFIMLSTSFAFSALDLKWVGDITLNPDPPCAGNKIKFEATYRTWGGPVDNLKVEGAIDGNPVCFSGIAHIDQGVNTVFTCYWMATPGSHTVTFTLDLYQTAGDSNYSNNALSKTFNVSNSCLQPDLTIKNVKITPSPCNNGDTVTINFNVANIGTAPSVSTVASFWVKAVVDKIFNIPAINAGGTFNITHTWQAQCDAEIWILVDSKDWLEDLNKESNEYNNKYSNKKPCFKLLIQPGLEIIAKTHK